MDADATAGADHRHSIERRNTRAFQYLVGRDDGIADDGDLGWVLFVIEALRHLDKSTRRQLHKLGIAAIDVPAYETGKIVAQRLAVGLAPFAVAAGDVGVGSNAVAD
jgi:hypothetical protein